MTAVLDTGRERGRLDTLARLGSFEASEIVVMDRLARLAAEVLEAPIGLVCLVEVARQVFLGAHGLPEELLAVRQTPLPWSVCQHAVASGQPLIVNDTHRDGDLAHHPAVSDFGIAAYAGTPLIAPGGHVLGTVCVMDRVARDWRADQLSFLDRLARIVIVELAAGRLLPPDRAPFL